MNGEIKWWVIAALVFLIALTLSSAGILLRWGLGSDRSGGIWERWRPGVDADWEIRQIAFLPFRCLMPALFITLVVMGIIGLVRIISALPDQGVGGPTVIPPRRVESQNRVCAECGRSVQAGWQVCPYCGQKLN